MKANLRPAAWSRIRQRLHRWSGKPAVETALHCLGAMAAGFVLAGAPVGGTWLPLPICLAAGLGLGLPSFAAYIGGCLGYILLWNGTVAMEPMAAGLLVEASLCIFSDQTAGKNHWFYSGSAMLFTALVGFLFLLEQRFAPQMVWRCAMRVVAAGCGTLCVQLALWQKNQLCRLILLAGLCAGGCALAPVGLPLGAVAACVLAASSLDTAMALPAAALCGLALDLAWGEGYTAAILTLGAMTAHSRNWVVRLTMWLLSVLLGILLTGASSLLLAAAIVGAALSRLIPPDGLFGAVPAVRSREEQRLVAAAGLLEQMSRCLQTGRRNRPDPETAAVFDQAAERVCRMCSLWDTCWNENVEETVVSLERAALPMMTRGKVLREDLPAVFTGRCRHLEGFLTAVNRELDDLSCRRQYRSRIRESRQVMARQYDVLSQALAREAPEQAAACHFRPEVGFRSLGRREDTVSGDRGATFRVGPFFYLILCDGMGTGPGAASEAGAAIGILRTLLQAGTMPGEAMELLNGIYILRDDGGFATVDLLQADLLTGEASLWKWGGAPSYLKSKGSLEKIGTAAPPPGVGVGEAHLPEETRLSLSGGEMLVLTSDGAGGEAAERFMRQYGGLSPRELAAGVVNCSQTQGEDDQTAAVLVLRPRSLGLS